MKIGLVLSGGMAKGAIQVGALQALSEIIPTEEIQYVSCASIGTLNGYAFATQKLDKAQEMWRDVCAEDSRVWISQALRSSFLQKDIKNLHAPDDRHPKEFYISLLDMSHETLVYRNIAGESDPRVERYLKASVAMPVFNKAIRIDGIPYFDGAMVDNIPVFPLMKKNLDYIICIYFDEYSYKFESKAFDSKVLQVTFPPKNFLKQSLVMTPDYIDEMIDVGYNHTVKYLKRMIGPDYTDIERVRYGIEKRNAFIKDAKVRVTGDFIVTNFNKVTQKLAKRKIEI